MIEPLFWSDSGWQGWWHANLADDILLYEMWWSWSSSKRCQQGSAASRWFSTVFSGICQQQCWKVSLQTLLQWILCYMET